MQLSRCCSANSQHSFQVLEKTGQGRSLCSLNEKQNIIPIDDCRHSLRGGGRRSNRFPEWNLVICRCVLYRNMFYTTSKEICQSGQRFLAELEVYWRDTTNGILDSKSCNTEPWLGTYGEIELVLLGCSSHSSWISPPTRTDLQIHLKMLVNTCIGHNLPDASLE